MSSTNIDDAKKECSNNPSCYMFYKNYNLNTPFSSCESTARIIDGLSWINEFLYIPRGKQTYM